MRTGPDSLGGGAGSYSCPRRHERSLYSAPITLHHLMPGGVQSSHGLTLDISEAGLGAILSRALYVGETVEIDLPLAGHNLSAVAIVRHSSRQRAGFEFLGLTPEERGQINAVVAAC